MTKLRSVPWMCMVLGLVLLLSTVAAGTVGPPGGPVLHLAIDPTDAMTVYAATPAGVLKTTDGGETWFPSNDGVTAVPHRIAIDPTNPQTIYLGTIAGAFGDPRLAGIFKSTDGGSNWHQINIGITSFVQVPSLAIDPTNPNVIYAATGGVHKTVDGGETWMLTTLVGMSIRALVIDPDDSQTVYAGSQVGLFRTRDGGSTWIRISTVGRGIVALVMDPATRWLYAGTDGGGVFLSQDRGESWMPISIGLTNLSVFALLITPDAVYAATAGGIFKSIDAGMTWGDASKGLSTIIVFALASAPDDSSTVYAGTSRTIFKSTDSGTAWRELKTGLTQSSYQTVFAVAIPRQDSMTLYAGTGVAGIVKSVDGGSTWFDVNNNLPNVNIRTLVIHPFHPEIVYAGAALGGMGVEKTVDGGETWLASGLDQLYAVALAMDPADPNTLYASVRELNGGLTGGIYKTTNAGKSWSHVLGAHDDISSEGIAVDPRDSNIVYSAAAKTPCRQHCELRGVFKSEDAGSTWAQVNDGLTNLDVTSIVFDPRDSNILYATTIGSGIFKSIDGARSWRPTGLTEGNVTSVIVHPDHPNILFAGLRELGVFKSTDGGCHWQEANRGLDTRDVNSLTMDPNNPSTLYAATWAGGVFVSYDSAKSWQ